MDSLSCSRRAQFRAIFPRDGFEAGAVMNLDKAGWTDWTKRQADRQKKTGHTKRPKNRQTDRQTYNIHA